MRVRKFWFLQNARIFYAKTLWFIKICLRRLSETDNYDAKNLNGIKKSRLLKITGMKTIPSSIFFAITYYSLFANWAKLRTRTRIELLLAICNSPNGKPRFYSTHIFFQYFWCSNYSTRAMIERFCYNTNGPVGRAISGLALPALNTCRWLP